MGIRTVGARIRNLGAEVLKKLFKHLLSAVFWTFRRYPKVADVFSKSFSEVNLSIPGLRFSQMNPPESEVELKAKGNRNLLWDRARLKSAKNHSEDLISIVVVSRNGGALLKQLLYSIRLHEQGENFEIVVILQDSTDNSLKVIEDFKKDLSIFVLENNHNDSFSVACNKGAQHANGGVLVFCNNDVKFVGPSIRKLANRLISDEIGVIGVLQKSDNVDRTNENYWHAGIYFAYNELTKFLKPINISVDVKDVPNNDLFRVWAVNGGFMGITKSVFLEVGGFDEDYDFGYEDVDLSLKVYRQLEKHAVLDTSIEVIHNESTTRKKWNSIQRSERFIRNTNNLILKHGVFLQQNWMFNKIQLEEQKLDYAAGIVAVTTAAPSDSRRAFGDSFVAAGLLNGLLEHYSFDAEYVEHDSIKKYGFDKDIMLLMRHDSKPLGSSFSPYNLKIAWIRNRLNEWVERDDLHSFDFFYVSSTAAKDLFERRTRYSATVLPIAVDSMLFTGMGRNVDRPIDVLLSENFWNTHRSFHDWKPDEGFEVATVGANWNSPIAPKRLARHWVGQKYFGELPLIYADAKIVIDDATAHTEPHGQLNMRVFEALQSGALVLSNNKIGIREIFGDEFPFWDSPDEINDLVNYFLNKPEERLRFVEKGQNEVRQRHTYEIRSRQVVSDLSRLLKQPVVRFMIPCPSANLKEEWGDYHLAKGLAFEMSLLGYRTKICFLDEWYTDQVLHSASETRIVIRGLTEYNPRPIDQNIIWVISHPDLVGTTELKRFDLVFAASRKLNDNYLDQGLKSFLFEQATDGRREVQITPASDRSELPIYLANSRGVQRKTARLSKSQSVDLEVHGRGWKEGDFSKGSVLEDPIPNDQLLDFYGRNRFVVNDAWPDMNEWGIVSNRVLDAGFAGCIVVTETIRDENHPLKPFVIEFENNLQDAIEQAKEAGWERERRKIREIIENSYTFEVRAKEFERILGKHLGVNPALYEDN